VSLLLLFRPMSGIGGEPEPEPEPEPEVVVDRRPVRGRRYEIIEDPDKLCEELKREEKLVEKEKKTLKILVKRRPSLEGRLYQQLEARIEKLEAKIDDRLERMAVIAAAIQCGLDKLDEEYDDDEDILNLS
jgi:hypothetical protein